MKKIFTLAAAGICVCSSMAQDLPKGFGEGERERMDQYLKGFQAKTQITTPPPHTRLRNAAEWEEVQSLFITWTSYPSIHRQIIKAVQNDTKVTIVCSDSNTVKNNLNSNNVPLTNLRFLVAPFNSVWIRDYFGNSVYGAYVDSLVMVDWIYNRPRPLDDVVPAAAANNLGLALYETVSSPNYNLIHTGGNYMSDGFGTAFSSTLTDTENPSKTAAQIDSIMKKFMGITRYIRMPTLPYDGIHHIDMHMKLLNEETLLVGEYPPGVADGPQIEANLQWVLANFNSVYGTPYKVVRIPMPKDKNNKWPSQNGGWYCTYANGVFVNKTYIFPTYYQQYDTTAFRIMKQALPGYKLVGIDCDEAGATIIAASGAIHCITHAVHASDPLLISHQPLTVQCDTSTYKIKAKIMHRSGIAAAQVRWTIDTLQGFASLPMALSNSITSEYTAAIPPQPAGATVYYYISATSLSGKTIARPMPAPLSRWTFPVSQCVVSAVAKQEKAVRLMQVYPNPASAITCIPLKSIGHLPVSVKLYNMLGALEEVIFDGHVNGEKNVFLHAGKYAAGVYFIEMESGGSKQVQKLIIR